MLSLHENGNGNAINFNTSVSARTRAVPSPQLQPYFLSLSNRTTWKKIGKSLNGCEVYF